MKKMLIVIFGLMLVFTGCVKAQENDVPFVPEDIPIYGNADESEADINHIVAELNKIKDEKTIKNIKNFVDMTNVPLTELPTGQNDDLLLHYVEGESGEVYSITWMNSAYDFIDENVYSVWVTATISQNTLMASMEWDSYKQIFGEDEYRLVREKRRERVVYSKEKNAYEYILRDGNLFVSISMKLKEQSDVEPDVVNEWIEKVNFKFK